MSRRHLHRSPWKRGFYSAAIITAIVGFGTVGMHRLEGMSYLDAFYFMSMIATAQGPAAVPHTVAGKLFAACIAYVSVGAVIGALGYFFGPFFGQLWHLGVQHLEEEARILLHRKDRSP